MTRKGFKNRLKVTRNSIEKFCQDLKIVRILYNSERPDPSKEGTTSLLSDDEELSNGFYKTLILEKLDLSSVGPSFEPREEENIPLISTPRKNFDLPRSPRFEVAYAERNPELKIFRRKSIESPRAFLNGQSGINSLPVIAKKEKADISDVLLVVVVSALTFNPKDYFNRLTQEDSNGFEKYKKKEISEKKKPK